MTTTLDKIKNAYKTARVQRKADAIATLSTLLGEIERSSFGPKGKVDLTDSTVVSLVKKAITNNEFTSKHAVDNTVLQQEHALLAQFLPEQYTGEKLEELLNEVLFSSNSTDFGANMKYLKANYAGQYDGVEAARVLKKILVQ